MDKLLFCGLFNAKNCLNIYEHILGAIFQSKFPFLYLNCRTDTDLMDVCSLFSLLLDMKQ